MSALPTPEDVVERSLRPATPDVGSETWQIDDHGAASWALAMIRKEHVAFDLDTSDTRVAIEALRAEADRLEEKVDARAKERDRSIGFFSERLTSWLRRLREQDPKTTSVTLPGGRVRSRAGSRRAVIDPAQLEALADFARREDPGLIKVEPRKKAILDYVKATGELPPGVTVEQGETTFQVVLDD